MSKRLAECQRVIGYHFANPQLLEIALTHSSVRTPDRECNERQEFLGDSVLGLAITEELYKRLPDQQEGELTRIKSAVVSRGALYRVSTKLQLTRFIEVAKGVVRRDELPVSLTANLVESIIGAIYLDAGFFPAREFILRFLGPEVEDVLYDRVPKNYKSLLQHESQQMLGVTPVYRTVEEEGPDHRKHFTVAALVRGREYGRASGVNKKEAEQESARKALEALQRGARQGRRRRGGGSTPPPRERDDMRRAPRAPGTEDEAWKAWAESGRTEPAPASAPYVIGPESDEGWADSPASPPAPAFAEGLHEPTPAPSRADPFIAPEADSAPAPAAAGDEPATRRRRGGRRGGRGRRGAEKAGEPRAEGAPAPEATSDESAPAPAADAPAAGAPEAGAPERVADGDRPVRPGPRERLARYRAPRGARGASRAEAAESAAPPLAPSPPAVAAPAPSAPPAPPPAPPPSAPSTFGKGVIEGAPPPPRQRREATPPPPVVEAPAVRKAPKAPKPASGGGFGEGI